MEMACFSASVVSKGDTVVVSRERSCVAENTVMCRRHSLVTVISSLLLVIAN